MHMCYKFIGKASRYKVGRKVVSNTVNVVDLFSDFVAYMDTYKRNYISLLMYTFRFEDKICQIMMERGNLNLCLLIF